MDGTSIIIRSIDLISRFDKRLNALKQITVYNIELMSETYKPYPSKRSIQKKEVNLFRMPSLLRMWTNKLILDEYRNSITMRGVYAYSGVEREEFRANDDVNHPEQ